MRVDQQWLPQAQEQAGLLQQVLFLDPEENITTVREHLKRMPYHRVALVIPPQTELRSYVAWRLLEKYSKELDKAVLIVSGDPHMRAIAHSVHLPAVPSLPEVG
jgi:hypothetical protein